MEEEIQQASLRHMQRLQAGDDLALNDLMQQWQKPLIHFLFRYVGDEVTAIDLAQETFVRLYEHRHRFRPHSSFSAWLFQIAINLARNHHRWKQRHPTIPGEINPQTPATDPMPWEALAQQEKAHAISQAIQALPDDLRTALLLFEYENQSHAEIAQTLQCTPKAIETRLYRARQLLKKSLAPWLKTE